MAARYTLKPLPEPPALTPKASPPAPEAVSPPAPQTPGRAVRQALVRTRGGHAFYVPSQRKMLQPSRPAKLVLDRWVMNQIKHGTLEIVDA